MRLCLPATGDSRKNTHLQIGDASESGTSPVEIILFLQQKHIIEGAVAVICQSNGGPQFDTDAANTQGEHTRAGDNPRNNE